MSIQVSGEIIAPQFSREHSTPTGPIHGGDASPDEDILVVIGTVANQGNINQTVTVTEIINAENCTFVKTQFAHGETVTDGAVELAPGAQAELRVIIHTANEAMGTDPTPYSFEVEPVWS